MILTTMGKLSDRNLEISLVPSEEEVRSCALNEGMWDSVKDGLRVLSNKVTAAFESQVSVWTSKISEIVLAGRPEELVQIVEVVVQASKESGESIPWDDTLKAAKEFGSITKEQAVAIVEDDLKGPVKEKAASVTEGKYISGLYSLLKETSLERTDRIDESLTLTGVLGIGFALLGGVPLVLKGLHKLAVYLNATKTAELLKRSYEITHKIEEKTIDWMIPDKLSWLIYQGLQKRGIKTASTKLSYDEFKADKGHAKSKIEGLVYKVILIYFAFSGISSVLHAGVSLLSFVEGGATAVKGIELAKGAIDIAKMIEQTAEIVS